MIQKILIRDQKAMVSQCDNPICLTVWGSFADRLGATTCPDGGITLTAWGFPDRLGAPASFRLSGTSAAQGREENAEKRRFDRCSCG